MGHTTLISGISFRGYVLVKVVGWQRGIGLTHVAIDSSSSGPSCCGLRSARRLAELRDSTCRPWLSLPGPEELLSFRIELGDG